MHLAKQAAILVLRLLGAAKNKNPFCTIFPSLHLNVCCGSSCSKLSPPARFNKQDNFPVTLNCHLNPVSRCWHTLSSGLFHLFFLTLLFPFSPLYHLVFHYFSAYPRLDGGNNSVAVMAVVKTQKTPSPHFRRLDKIVCRRCRLQKNKGTQSRTYPTARHSRMEYFRLWKLQEVVENSGCV